MNDLGSKLVTKENWLKPSEVLTEYLGVPLIDDWIDPFLQPVLSDNVPVNVRKLFEVARGVMVYGYFFYPALALAVEQLPRVADTAVEAKCEEKGAPSDLVNSHRFYPKLQYLLDNGIISKQEYDMWDVNHKARNIVSHPQDQMILTPEDAVGVLSRFSNEINSLFP